MGLSSVALGLSNRRSCKVFRMGFSNKMSRVDTRWVITCMAYLKSFWDNSMCKHVRHSVGKDGFVSPLSKRPVTERKPTAEPQPTFFNFAFFDLSPKAFFRSPSDYLRSQVGHRVTVSLPSAIMHSTPAPFIDGLTTGRNRTRVIHV